MTTEEINELLRAGFYEEDQSWRHRTEIKAVPDFKPEDSAPTLNTYGKMLHLSGKTLATGEYKSDLRRFGRGAAVHFLKVFNETVGSGHAVVAFLNGCDVPRCDAVIEEHGGLTIRGYYDFGVSSA